MVTLIMVWSWSSVGDNEITMNINQDYLLKKWSTLLNSTNSNPTAMLIEPMETPYKALNPQ